MYIYYILFRICETIWENNVVNDELPSHESQSNVHLNPILKTPFKGTSIIY